MRELERLAFSDIKNYIESGSSGITLQELSEMPEEFTRAISDLTVDLNGTVRFKLYNKLDSIKQYREHTGMTKDESGSDRPNINLQVNFVSAKPQESDPGTITINPKEIGD